MGRATRWLKGFLGMKRGKDTEYIESGNSVFNDKKEKRRWSFGKDKSGRDFDSASPGQILVPQSGMLRPYVAKSDKEHNKLGIGIGIAVSKSAAANKEEAAPREAAVVVRPMKKGRGSLVNGGRENLAALQIQAVFRGFLSRRALRALRALVRLQALARGYLVRKRTAETLHSMQALVRAQVAIRSERARRSFEKENRIPPENRPGKSLEKLNETKSEFHSKKLSAQENSVTKFDDNPKIVEIDTFNRGSRSRRIHNPLTELCHNNIAHIPFSSPIPRPVSARHSVPDTRRPGDTEWCFTSSEFPFGTLQCSNMGHAAATPTKSVYGDGMLHPNANVPNYMANTQSFKAKSRSYSVPRQRPELINRKKLSLSDLLAARHSISGVKMQRSFDQVEQLYY